MLGVVPQQGGLARGVRGVFEKVGGFLSYWSDPSPHRSKPTQGPFSDISHSQDKLEACTPLLELTQRWLKGKNGGVGVGQGPAVWVLGPAV